MFYLWRNLGAFVFLISQLVAPMVVAGSAEISALLLAPMVVAGSAEISALLIRVIRVIRAIRGQIGCGSAALSYPWFFPFLPYAFADDPL